MNSSYTLVVICLLLFSGINKTIANSFSPLFFDCTTDTLSLCVEDAGVRLPNNNKSFLGESHPDATSCSVHVSQSIKVSPTCLGVVQYEVQLVLFDSGDPIVLQSSTTTITDSLLEAELFFDSELSPDTNISQNGIPYTTGCERYHRIKWIVTDSCGLVSVCEVMMDVYDCSTPETIVPSYALQIVIPIGGLLTLYTSDIVIETMEDCTDSMELLFSFSETEYLPFMDYDPCEAPGLGVEYPFPFWVADAGRDINCNGSIEWEERNKYAESFNIILTDIGNVECYDIYTVGGHVKTVKQRGMIDVEVQFEEPGHVYPTALTDSEGYYQTAFELNGHTITITPEKTDNPKAGISTLDLVRIQKHLLGIDEFESPYQYISADANNSQSATAIDLVELRKLLLGIYTELPNNKSWRFIAEDYVFGDTTHPWPHPGSITLFLDSSVLDANFIGVKIGDVNSSAPFTSGDQIEIRKARPEILWVAEQQSYQKGDEIEINIRANSNIDLQGFQLTISSPDLLFTDVSSASFQLDESTYSNFGDRMTMSWFDQSGVSVSQGDIIFTLNSIATKSGNLRAGLTVNSEITEAEVYSMKNEIFTPQLLIGDPNEINTSIAMPNPWRDKTKISFNVEEDGDTQIDILDLNGRQIYSETKYLLKGKNEIVLESKNFEVKGMLMYSIKSGNTVITERMVVID